MALNEKLDPDLAIKLRDFLKKITLVVSGL